MSIVDVLREARSTGSFQSLVDAIPYATFLGVRVEESGGQLLGRLPFSEHLVGNPTLPALHGGTLGALMEAAAQFELMFRAQSLVLPKTITITVDYLRSAKAKDTFVRAAIVRHGRRVATVHARAWQDAEAEPVAMATVHLLVLGAER